jgi:DNA processing protein
MEHPVRQLGANEFPPLLSEISDPPARLYARGRLPSYDLKWLAVVGSREATRYGIDACKGLIAGLRGLPVVIVSGLALGIDGVAHRSALENGLPTVGVPGSGLDDSVLYPRTHLSLAHDILEAGSGLLSEFDPSFKARPESFPQRNRIMAGLCHAVLVVEAAEKSGTLITARLAAEYNRDLLCVMGPIFSETSFGPHLFMKVGAVPVRTSADIMETLGLERTEPAQRALPALSAQEARVMALLAEPRSREELIQALDTPAKDTNILLAAMELKGFITEEMGVVRNALI